MVKKNQGDEKMKKPPGRPSKYPYVFRRMIAENALSGAFTFRELAQDYKVPQGCVSKWKQLYEKSTLEEMIEKKPKSDRLVNKVITL